MKHSGRILFCLVCGMVWSAISQADVVTPHLLGPTNIALQRKLFLEKLKEKREQLKVSTPSRTAPGMATPMNTPPASGIPQTSSSPQTESNANTPYGSIITRNVFGLNPITPQSVQPPDTTPPPKITLTGITTIFGPAEALYKVAGVVKPGQPPQDESYILQEGQGEDGVEVVHIDVEKNKVTFNNNGVTQDLLLMAGVASGGAAPASMPQPNFGGPRGIGQRPIFNNLPAALRQRLEQRYNSQNGPGPSGNNNFNSGGQTSYGGQSSYNSQGSSSQTSTGLSGDDQQALIAAQKAQLEQEGNPKASIFPSTKYDDEARQELNGGGGQPPPP